MERPSGSKAERIRQCPASAVLPHVDSTEIKPYAIRGVVIHAYLERVRELGIDGALALAPEPLRPFLACIDVDAIPVDLATEVAFAWDWKARRAREIGRNLNRDYGKADPPLCSTEIPLTVDIFGVEQFPVEGQAWSAIGQGYVGDYKTGRTRYPKPERFAQTLLGALCVRDLYKTTEVVVELIYIDFDGDSFRQRGIADDWILDDFADELAAAMDLVSYYEVERLAGREIPVRQGPHCDHCPAFKRCPAKTALVRALPVELEIMTDDMRGGLSREHMAEAWRRCEQLKSLIGAVQTEICMAAAREPLDLGDGMRLGTVTTKREYLVGPVAASVIEQWYGAEARTEAVTVKVSKEALRTAVAARRKPGEKIASKKGDGALDRILAEIKRRDGIELHITTDVKVHHAKRQLTTGDE